MHPVSPVVPLENLKEIIVAKNQDEYQNLPVIFCADDDGNRNSVAVCRWELSDKEIEEITRTKSVWCYIWVFGKPFNPMLLSTEVPVLQINEDYDE